MSETWKRNKAGDEAHFHWICCTGIRIKRKIVARKKKENKIVATQEAAAASLPSKSIFFRIFSEMPPWLFWALFLVFTGYFLVVKISSNDLWWHMACGRYTMENGVYPPTDTFTFSPVRPTTPNAATWLGDVVLYFIYAYLGNETGLQIFRIVAMLAPIGVFLWLGGKSYNSWTLLGSVVIIFGTLQQQILRNSIFAMIFVPLMVLIWHLSSKNKNFKYLLLFPAILAAWAHMHGYALVGLVLLILFFIGEVVDAIIFKTERNMTYLAALFLVVAVSWAIVSVNWSLNPVAIMKNLISNIGGTLSVKEEDRSGPAPAAIRTASNEAGIDEAKSDNLFDDSGADMARKAESIFRPFFESGDAEIVTEYKSPFKTTFALNVKMLFGFLVAYLIYMVAAVRIDPSGIRFSYLLPSLATAYLGLGYQRTVAFPFLAAMPLIAPHFKKIGKILLARASEEKAVLLNMLPWIGAMAYLCTACYFYAPANFYPLDFFGLRSIGIPAENFVQSHPMALLTLLYAALISYWIWVVVRKEQAKPYYSTIVVALAIPALALLVLFNRKPVPFFQRQASDLLVYAVIPAICLGIARLTPTIRNRWFFRYNPAIIWSLPLLFLLQFFFTNIALYKETNYLVITGMSNRQPGLGRNNYLSDTMPEYVFKNYKNENMFNSYNLGSYLLWKWYPEKKVFIDSRSMDYQADFYQDYMRNRSYNYIESMNLKKAVLSILHDRSWFEDYLAQNWAVLAFDNSMMLLKRRTEKGYESSYGIIPKYIGKSDEIDDLPLIDRIKIGLFINDMIKYMLLFGRLDDTVKMVDTIQPVIDKLTPDQIVNIRKKQEYMKALVENIGSINDPVIADISRRLTKDYSPLNLILAIGDAHRRLKHPKEAALTYFSAAQLAPENVELQRKVADRMFELKSLNLAITQYEKLIALAPEQIDAYHRLAYLYSMKRDYESAEKMLRQLLQRAPMQQETYLNLAEVLQAAGKKNQAIEVCTKGMEKLPGNIALKLKLDQLNE